MAKATVQVLPCPFCGGVPEMEPWHGGGPDKRLISCVTAECNVSPSAVAETPREAADHWNKRVRGSGADYFTVSDLDS